MGQLISGGPDLAQTILQNSPGAFTGATSGNPVALLGDANISVWGVFVGTVVLEQSSDGGVTWIPEISRFNNTAVSFTAPGALTIIEPEPGVQYRLRCSVFTSGTINWRIAAGANVQANIGQRLT